MSLIKAKQLDKLLGTLRRTENAFTLAASGSAVVTTAFTGKVSGGSDTVAGVFTTSPFNKVVLIDTDTGKPTTDGMVSQVYGRLTFAAGVWTVTFYTIVAGTETPYTFVAGNPSIGKIIALIYGESVQLKDIAATDVINGLDNIDESDFDPNSHYEFQETLPVTAPGQTAFTLTNLPKMGSVKMFVNGQLVRDFTVVTNAVTFLATFFPLETTDEVVFIYNV